MPELDLVGIFRTLQGEFGLRVDAVSDAQWGAPTPNAEWDVADLVGHLITEHRWVEPLMRGLDLDAAAGEVDAIRAAAVHDGYPDAWDDVARRAGEAFSAPGALEQTVLLSRGPTVGGGYIRELIFDLTVHTWDLGRAIDWAGELPSDIVSAVWGESRQFTDLSASGMFDRPVVVPDDAPVLDRLIAMTGRDPR
ncbi:TIGR03086 family metal-binding protein [uncultured Jatrophihabitans sp.]|uniref:TIGR03086 family metal-binding protein n=1 Tax=uncultured Jatrophihabitans sp. TaxID=1610747 RepID=UPI0035CC4E39